MESKAFRSLNEAALQVQLDYTTQEPETNEVEMPDMVFEYFSNYFGDNLNEDTSDEDIMNAVYDLVELSDAVCESVGLDEGFKKMQRQKKAFDKQTKRLKATQPGWQGNSPAEIALNKKKAALGAKAEYKLQASGGKEHRNIENLRTKAVSGEGGVKPSDVIKRKHSIYDKRSALERTGTRTEPKAERGGMLGGTIPAEPGTKERIGAQIDKSREYKSSWDKKKRLSDPKRDTTHNYGEGPISDKMQSATAQIKQRARKDREAVTADKYAGAGELGNIGRRIRRLARKATGRKIPTYHGGNKPKTGYKKYGEPIIGS